MGLHRWIVRATLAPPMKCLSQELAKIATWARSACVYAIAVLAGWSCVAKVTIPDPPDLSALAERYASPTASLDPNNVHGLIAEYEQRLQLYERFGGFSGVLAGMEDLRKSISADESGGLQLNSVPVAADAVLHVSGRCGNRTGSTSGQAGEFELQIIVRDSRLVPVAWGEVINCFVHQTVNGQVFEGLFDGRLAFYFPSLAQGDEKLPDEVIARYAFDDVIMQDESLGPQHGHFRVHEGELSFLIDLGDQGTVVATRMPIEDQVGLQGRDRNLVCLVSTRACADKS